MNITDAEFVRGFIRMCDDGWKQGGHERNGGNLSYRIKPEEVELVRPGFSDRGEWKPAGTAVPELAGEFFMVTGSGRYFSNVARSPEETTCIIELDDRGENYRICSGLTDGGTPTSELPGHLMSHAVKKRVSGGAYRVIYHAHPANIIALTFVLPLESRVFTRELWEMEPECAMVFPAGIGVAGWMVPGGKEIAEVTGRLMEEYDVAVWAHHGMFCAGEDFDLTFGLMHTVEKAAEILVKTLSMRQGKRQTVTTDQLRRLAGDLGLTLPEKFLYGKEENC